MNIAVKLKELRTAKDISQKDIADYLTITRSAYTQYETGKRIPPCDVLIKLATYFDVTTDYLLDMPQSNKPLNVEQLVKTRQIVYKGKLLSADERNLLLRVISALFPVLTTDEIKYSIDEH